MTHRHRRLRRDDRGAQAVEFAIIAPVLVLLVCALVSLGFLYMSQITLSQAAREGARAAAICGAPTQTCIDKAKAVVMSHSPGITITAGMITVTTCPSASDTSSSARVTIQYQWNLGIPPFDSGGVTLHGTSTTPCGG